MAAKKTLSVNLFGSKDVERTGFCVSCVHPVEPGKNSIISSRGLHGLKICYGKIMNNAVMKQSELDGEGQAPFLIRRGSRVRITFSA